VNQILYTGEERVEKSVNKQKKVLPINVIVVLFSITIIVLGICLVAGSIYSKQKINETVQANIRPEIQVERNDDDNTIAIKVTHIRGIKTVTYRWNDEEETRLDGKNRKSVSQIIDLIGGENTLKISVVEENGQIRTFEKTFIAGNIPEITLEGVANGVKIIATSEERQKMIEKLDTSLVDVNVLFGQTEITMEEFLDLKEGDVLKLDNDASEDLIVRVNGERKFYARAGKIKEKICVKITDRYDYYVDALKRYF